MAATPIFPLAVWAAGTNQNSVPANDNALRLQALSSPAAGIADAAPVSPAENAQYIVGTAWGGFATKSIVIYKGGTWYEFAPIEGMLKDVAGVLYRYHTAAWEVYTGGSDTLKVAIPIAISDETTVITSGAAKVTFRMPHAMTLEAVRASLGVAQASGSIFTVDINEDGASVLSTKLTVDNTEKTSTTAAAPAVISDANLADDAEITIDIDQVGDGTAKGLKVYLIGTRPA
jgi:hypothetical protein